MRALPVLVIALLLPACVWRTDSPQDQPTVVPDLDGVDPVDTDEAGGPERVAPGITRKVSQLPDGDELVQVHVDLDEAQLEPPPQLDLLPRPFTAAQIRDSLTTGTKLGFHVSGSRTPEADVVWEITSHADDGVEITYEVLTADGERRPPEAETFSWAQLEEHASYPTEIASRTEGEVTVGSGTYKATRYDVRPPDAFPPVVESFWFADTIPGPPVLHTIEEGGQLVHRMELTTFERPKK